VTDLEHDRYPIGRFQRCAHQPDREQRATWIDDIERAPADIRALAEHLSDAQLETRYRLGGWTIRQVVHHVPDSHMNAYVRMKVAVTEDSPSIKAYEEARWAELPDGKSAPAEISLALLEALHRRWVPFMRNLADTDFAKAYVHPELGPVALDEALSLYAWHSRHHEGHVRLGLAAAIEK
jgi:hypothetical protein